MIDAQCETGLVNSMINLGDLIFKKAKVQEVGGFETTKPIEGKVTISAGCLPVSLEYPGVESKTGLGMSIGPGIRSWTGAC